MVSDTDTLDVTGAAAAVTEQRDVAGDARAEHVGADEVGGIEGDSVPTGSAWAQLVFAIAAVAVGAVLVQQAATIPGGLSPAGPRFLPTWVGVGWLVLSIAYVTGIVVRLARHHQPLAAERFDRLPRVVALLAVLIAYAFVLEPVGYLLSTAVFLAVAAAILGSRSHVRDAAIALVLAVLLYFLFSRSLGIFLPSGVIPV